jgi:hypothetical protein
MDQSSFDAGLSSYKSTLTPMYKQKAMLIAQREILRFQYLTGMKSQVEQITGAMYSQSMLDQNADGLNALTSLVAVVKKRIPMSDMTGTPLPGWAASPGPGTGASGVLLSVLCPIEEFISKPWSQPTAPIQLTALQNYPGNYFAQGLSPGQYLAGPFYFFSPPDAFSIKNIGSRSSDAAINYALNIASLTYNGITLSGVMTAAQNLWASLSNKTIFILNLQSQIEAQETALSTFVSQNQDFAGGMNALQVLADLQAQSDSAATPPPPPPAPVVLPLASTPPVTVTGPPNTWMDVVAAAVAGVLMMGKKNG